MADENVVDARGLSCPIPVIRTKKALDAQPDELVVLVDAQVQVENVTRMAKSKGYVVKEVKKEGDTFRILIVRGK